MSQQDVAEDNSFVVPDETRLSDLGPGCFVRVRYQAQNMWVEITEMHGVQFQGRVHSELGAEPTIDVKQQWHINDINALGCNRYCACD